MAAQDKNMLKEPGMMRRQLKTLRLSCDLAIVGGGLAGACGAITAARQGLKVVLIQDRPVLGGNASSEVRLWILGATSHMGNNNRWAREGGVVDELFVENLYRNPEGNPIILDTLLLEKVIAEPNITLLLNTAVYDLGKSDADTIESICAFCSQNSTTYEVSAPLFVDASGDGIVGFLAGAAFRMGAEARSEFGEQFAPGKASHELLGHTLYFYSKDTGRPVSFVAPSYALKDIRQIPRFREIKAGDSGCRFWWFEWGGRFDTVHETERIKWELWKIVYGVWDYIKNSGQFPEAETFTLEWVGTIPGKRESRRFEGDYLLIQQDIVQQRPHPDAVSFGGWAMDLHPADGVYSELPACTQWHSKGVYPIPYRCLYSRNVSNLFLAGRLISASHVAFGSTRVMATCAHNGQAVGMAAALCVRHGLKPRDLLATARMAELQRELLRCGQYIPGVAFRDPEDLARLAAITASSELKLSALESCGETLPLDDSWGMMLPVSAGPMPKVEFMVDVSAATTLQVELRVSSRPENHTPDVTLARLEVPLKPGQRQALPLQFKARIDVPRYAFVCLLRNDAVAVHLSEQRVTGVLAVSHNANKAVTRSATQNPPPDIGVDTFEFWTARRRPGGKNFALKVEPPLAVFGAANLTNGFGRPTHQPNAWVADFAHEQPVLKLRWAEPQTIARVVLGFDTDYDHPMESVFMGHPERVMPFCVRNVAVCNATKKAAVKSPQTALTPGSTHQLGNLTGNSDNGTLGDSSAGLVGEIVENHSSHRVLEFDPPVTTDCLELRLVAPAVNVPASLFEVRCYGKG
jgi:hypothetical protein